MLISIFALIFGRKFTFSPFSYCAESFLKDLFMRMEFVITFLREIPLKRKTINLWRVRCRWCLLFNVVAFPFILRLFALSTETKPDHGFIVLREVSLFRKMVEIFHYHHCFFFNFENFTIFGLDYFFIMFVMDPWCPIWMHIQKKSCVFVLFVCSEII